MTGRVLGFFLLLSLGYGPVVWAVECFGVAQTKTMVTTSYETVTVADTAIGITAANVGALMMVTVETAPLRFRTDGTDPTATEGHLVGSGASFTVCGGGNILAFRAIRTTGTSAVLKVTQYKAQ